ncbi:MAG: hypothetical protein AB7E40_15605 [Pseudomonas sp.]
MRTARPTSPSAPAPPSTTIGVCKRDMGVGQIRPFMRYYEIPGYAHAASTVFNAA